MRVSAFALDCDGTIAVNGVFDAGVRDVPNALTDSSTVPGIQYVVVTSSGVLFGHASGWADIRHRVPVDGATTMMAYSMSKTITAAAVLQLVETGRVGLEQSIERYHRKSPGRALLLQGRWWRRVSLHDAPVSG
jgi:CubicO group peptidase (beta-lactamase class C family)